jgi:endonuclease YncB( thermonuclease family)
MNVTALLLLAALSTFDGQARVIDGDTLVIAGQHIRLDGIDAPETKQVCKRDGDRRCGLASRAVELAGPSS